MPQAPTGFYDTFVWHVCMFRVKGEKKNMAQLYGAKTVAAAIAAKMGLVPTFLPGRRRGGRDGRPNRNSDVPVRPCETDVPTGLSRSGAFDARKGSSSTGRAKGARD